MTDQEKAELAIKLLRSARRYLTSSGPQAMNAIYIPPAQAMRNAADALEAQDSLIRAIDDFLSDPNQLI